MLHYVEVAFQVRVYYLPEHYRGTAIFDLFTCEEENILIFVSVPN